MADVKERVPAIEGWFTTGEAPALLGSRWGLRRAASYFFPAGRLAVPEPGLQRAGSSRTVELSRRGRIWSFTDNRYQPPTPYVSADPFVPYVIVAVELAAERMVVLGQLVPGIDVTTLHAGDEVELVLGTLYEDDDHEYLVWKWQPIGRSGA